MGFPVQLATNSPDVVQAAEQAWGALHCRSSREPLILRVVVADRPGGPLPPAPVFRAQRSLVAIVSDAENFAVCDYTAGIAACWVTSVTVADPDYFAGISWRRRFTLSWHNAPRLRCTPPAFAWMAAACCYAALPAPVRPRFPIPVHGAGGRL